MIDSKEKITMSAEKITMSAAPAEERGSDTQGRDEDIISDDMEQHMRAFLCKRSERWQAEAETSRVMPTLTGIDRPLYYMQAVSKFYPDLTKNINEFRAGVGEDQPEWLNHCLMPFGGWIKVICEAYNISGVPPSLYDELTNLATIGTWRYCQGIYRIDPGLLAALFCSTAYSRIPCEALFRLPEYCVYVETPGFMWQGDVMHGFWAHLGSDSMGRLIKLWILADCHEKLRRMPIILGDGTIIEAVENTIRYAFEPTDDEDLELPANYTPRGRQRVLKKLMKSIRPVVNVLLYLCSDNPVIESEHAPGKLPARFQNAHITRSAKISPVARPSIWKVGAKA